MKKTKKKTGTIKINIKNLNEDNVVETLKGAKEIWKRIESMAIKIVNLIYAEYEDEKDEDEREEKKLIYPIIEVTSHNPEFKKLLNQIKLIFQKLKEKGIDAPIPFERFTQIIPGLESKFIIRDLEDVLDNARTRKNMGHSVFDILYESLRDTELFLDECIFKAKHKALFSDKDKKISDSAKVEFLDNEPALKCADKKCPLPPFKNEHFLCRVMFEYPINEAVDWSIVAEEMDKLAMSTTGKEKIKRSLYDTVRAINERVKEIFGIDKLFDWTKKTIKRIR